MKLASILALNMAVALGL